MPEDLSDYSHHELIFEVLRRWERLIAAVPQESGWMSVLVARSGVSFRALNRARRTRNKLAHPGTGAPGLVSRQEILRTLDIIKQAERGLNIVKGRQSSESDSSPAADRDTATSPTGQPIVGDAVDTVAAERDNDRKAKSGQSGDTEERAAIPRSRRKPRRPSPHKVRKQPSPRVPSAGKRASGKRASRTNTSSDNRDEPSNPSRARPSSGAPSHEASREWASRFVRAWAQLKDSAIKWQLRWSRFWRIAAPVGFGLVIGGVILSIAALMIIVVKAYGIAGLLALPLILLLVFVLLWLLLYIVAFSSFVYAIVLFVHHESLKAVLFIWLGLIVGASAEAVRGKMYG